MSLGFHRVNTLDTENFFFEVALGQHPEFSIIHKFGRNPAASTSWEDVWFNGGIYTWLTAAVQIEAISADVDDTATGDGAQAIRIEGLDENWENASEDIEMNGQSVTSSTTITFIRINRAYVIRCGTYSKTDNGPNQGAITIRTTSAGATHALIGADGLIGMGQTVLARYTVPKDHTAYVFGANIQVDSGKTAEVVMWQRPNANDVATAFHGAKRMVIHLDGVAGNVAFSFESIPGIFPEYTDIWWSIKASAAAGCSIDFPMILQHNETVVHT